MRADWLCRTCWTCWPRGLNPLEVLHPEGVLKRKGAQMAALVLFGGGGDLAVRMLLPSLYFLEHDGLLPEGLKIIGAARTEEDRAAYLDRIRPSIEAKARAD